MNLVNESSWLNTMSFLKKLKDIKNEIKEALFGK